MQQLRMIIWKEFAHIKADPMTIRLLIAPLLIQLFILGYALTTEVKHTTISVVDMSNTPESSSLISVIRENSLFTFAGYSQSVNQARELLDNGKAKIALVIPHDFAKTLRNSQNTSVQALVDGQDANSSSVASGYLSAIVSTWSFRYLKHLLAKAGVNQVLPIAVQPTVWYNPLLKSSWYMVPGLVVLLVTIMTSLLTGFSLIREKESGTLEQLLVTPVTPMQIIFGKIVPYILIGLVELTLVLILAILWFQVPFKGNLFVLWFFALIYMVSSLGIGIFASTVARNTQQVLFLLWFILIFFMFLSGFFLPLENMPSWVQKITYINPLRYFMFIIRELFLKGSGLQELWKEGMAMLAIGISVFGCAILFFNRRVG